MDARNLKLIDPMPTVPGVTIGTYVGLTGQIRALVYVTDPLAYGPVDARSEGIEPPRPRIFPNP